MRITQKDLDKCIEHLNIMTGKLHGFEIEYAYGGSRITANNGSVNLSKRGTKRETSIFLDGMLTSIQFQYQMPNKHVAANAILHLDKIRESQKTNERRNDEDKQC